WQECLLEAQKNHPDLISAQEDIKQSLATKDITGSGLFPQITASISGSTAKTTSRSSSDVITSSTSDSYKYGLSGSQLIFDGLKTIQDIKADTENIKASRQAFSFTSSQVRLRLRSAFVNLLRAQEMRKVAEDIFQIRRNNFELITLRYASGLEHKGALLTAEANVAQAELEMHQAARDLEIAQRQLTKEMGRTQFSPMQVRSDFAVNIEREKPDLEYIAQNNPYLKQLAFQKNAALYDIKSVYANFSPELTGSFGTQKSRSRWPPRDKQYNAGLTVSLPIFEGGLKFAQVSQAQSQYRQLEADERSRKDSILSSLEEAWAGLQDAGETVGVKFKGLRAAEERSQIAETQYSIGFLTYDNWIIIQDNFVSAKKAYLESRISALLAEAEWIYAKGETLEYVEKN
ncbi:MAG: TolC family protein, partial [Candidatus Omnitrophica bacterium]|nr:TolC family protein [Candidatus Omnitrophota bacterium]